MICLVIDSKTGVRSTIEFTPRKATLDNYLEVYGLVPAGQSLIKREKRVNEVGEDAGVI